MMPRLPERKASAIACGTSASASITFARASCALAFISCSLAIAIARRSSALACAIFLSASAWSIWSCAPIFFPTSISAISIERISNAVPSSSPLESTSLLIESGFSSTSLWLSALPIELTIPSPTRARIVSSPAPPTSWRIFARTVTRALAISWIPSLATAVTGGVSITFGLTDIWTASNTSRPARSIAVAIWKERSIPALLADTSACTTRSICPPAR